MTQADRVHSTPPTNTSATRRRFLSTTAALAAGSAALALAIPPALATDDPIFARIAIHKKLTADWQRLQDQLDEAEWTAAQEHGRRPVELIHWRNYHIGGSEIDSRREQLLEAGEIDPATVEQEYL